MSRQAKQLTVLAAVLAVLLGVYAGLRVWNNGSTDRENAAKQRVLQLADTTRLSFTNANGSFSFTKTDAGWSYDGNAAFPLSQAYPTAVATAVSDLAAVRSFAPTGALSDYGLDAPAYTLTAENADGSKTLLIGDATGSNYYAMIEGDDSTVYTVASSLVGQISYGLYDMIQLPSFSTMAETNIASIRLVKPTGEVTLAKQTVEASASSAAESGTDASSSASGAGSSSAGTTEKSYLWTVDGAEVPDGNLTLTEYLAALGSLSVTGCYDYAPTADTLAQCGLTSPTVLTVTLEDNTVTTLSFGTAASGGCYVQTGDSSAIWLMNADTASVLSSLSATNLLIVPQS